MKTVSFEVGDKVVVKVTKRGGRAPEERPCTVIEVVLAGRVPKRKGFYSTKKYDHVSYIVADATGERYRPIVSRISLAVPAPSKVTLTGAPPEPVAAPTPPARVLVTEYIFCLDASGSMSSAGLEEPTRKAFNAQIAALKASKVGAVFATLYSFGDIVTCLRPRAPIDQFEPLETFRAPGYSTALFDAIGKAITFAAPNPEASFVLQVLTDGGENSSKSFTPQRISKLLADTVATDRWTHALMLPRGARDAFLRNYPEIPAGNVIEWDTTQAGAERAGEQAVTATKQFMTSRSVGVTRSSSYFQPNLSAVTEADLAKCIDLSPHFKRYEAVKETTLREIVEERTKKPYVIGSAFYQLTKREDDVQGYKQILLRHRASRRIFGGAEARKLIGLQMRVDAKVEPGNHGDFEIYIESTSYNRIAPRGSNMLHDFNMLVPKQPTWDHAGAFAAANAKKNGANGVHS